MTLDHAALLSMLNQVGTDYILQGRLDNGATAIGMGLASAINRLKSATAKSKVIILLTDGSNNMGEILPLKAAEIAKNENIKVYTIGVGTNGTALTPAAIVGGQIQYLRLPVEIDTETLQSIADMTQGKFYRATNNEELKRIYQDIDSLEKSKFDVQTFVKAEDMFQKFILTQTDVVERTVFVCGFLNGKHE